ncbi:aminotransferase class V-fold PLP-dependent enzyme [Nocardioides sp. InS609-2]|uniref:kynureninase n=1 Tax=Nocardioides sp. InS609-2 TaxID=2760705 RepID=UPI0020BF2FAA|nr:aminotransferase class V-fold PLP-dependent enzyme [Nocardioides sp. InS609-2]
MTTTEAGAKPITDPAELDAVDELAGHRARFVGASSPIVYFDGNSLGRPLVATAQRLSKFVTDEWGDRLIRGWDERWMDLPTSLGDRLGSVLLGAAGGQTAIGDSTTVWLYKLMRAAVDHQQRTDSARTEIVIDTDNFPTDRYLAEGIAAERGLTLRWIEPDSTGGVTPELLSAAVGEATALVVLCHVAYKSAFLADGPALTRIAHDAGALVLWDLCHSAGSVPVDLDGWDADLAVGCTYKYLNGGPGSPAFGYVAARLHGKLTQPIQGWMGARDPFAMGPRYEPAAGIRGFISGTPAIVGMLAMQDMLDLIEEAGIDAVRAKSLALTSYTLELSDAWLTPLGVTVLSPRDGAQRGGHVTLGHPRSREVVKALWKLGVIPDYREPGGMRIGLSPLSTSFDEVHEGLAQVRALLSHSGPISG